MFMEQNKYRKLGMGIANPERVASAHARAQILSKHSRQAKIQKAFLHLFLWKVLALFSFFTKKKQKIAPTEICLVSAAKNRAKTKPCLRAKGSRVLRGFLTLKGPARIFYYRNRTANFLRSHFPASGIIFLGM
jgi:hypothetical protein